MSKKAITAGIIVSCICLFLYCVLTIVQYVLFNDTFKGGSTMGYFIAASNYLQSFSCWLVKIAAFFPMMLFFRCTLHWKKGGRWVILIAAVVAPWILSRIGNVGFSLCIQAIENSTMLQGIIELTVYSQFCFFADAISAFVWAAAVYGLGLAGKAGMQPAVQPAPPTEERHFNPVQDTPLE